MILQKEHIADSTQAASEVGDMALQGLYEPSPIAFTFETIGWSILAALLALIILTVVIFQIRKYIRNRYRREAIAEMEGLSQAPLSSTLVIVKRVAIQVFGREQVGSLHGREWLEFLEGSAKHVQFVCYEQNINQVLYTDQPVAEPLQQEIMSNAKNWIRHHAR